MYGYILCNNKQELNLSATDAVYEMHENFIIFNECPYNKKRGKSLLKFLFLLGD